MTEIAARLEAVHRRVRAAEAEYGRRPGSVAVLAVGKRHPSEALRAAYAAGQTAFGENYLQEALAKQEALADLEPVWHFIGGLQSNKTAPVAQAFSWVHTVDRAKIARRLGEQRPDGLPALNVCLQVNVSSEPQKAGCDPGSLPELAAAVAEQPRLRLRGLMAIPAPAAGLEQQRRPFARLRGLYEQLRGQGFALDTLSMGMTEDLEAAVAEGSTLLRIGTAIFGPREAEATEGGQQ
ncbi:YggS family pyridoxal phosphate-dependent enzyme [Halorhodospira neutriphila]|uniref:Pyridoxal phosphate homeostasis protein n=1 Tax=Halorhodospira neutriphila TaxID=168379 RepID=A0ABS1E6S1_9GAMM|nr:YggS family pyridoxal phosphate-dependent enzyme [Halorhodospira neutriphila]MBK1726658.1 YggS family pyridoxal phosphate-dependent enzyme [Halorhodospira neutriphila]